ncbi:MAG TPA: c-type cytochrome [Vicinamibacteria bacterium]|nr:c-type cytochrome [Vicinamibacteria bacterium]
MRSTRAQTALGTLGAAIMFGYLTMDLWDRPVQAAGGDRVSRGKYLVNAMGCHDCHTPKRMGKNGPEFDFSRALSGHPEGAKLPPAPRLPEGPWVATTSWDLTAWSGPWGVSYPINLTPDENTGLGIWTEEMFFKAMRTGRHMGASRPILPPMPWWTLGSLNDEDLSSVYAYLRSLPPIKNRVPEAVIAPAPGEGD